MEFKIMSNLKVKKQKAYYSISAVAKMFSVHQQTIRLYEKEGLLTPKRSEGNTRLFSEEDVNRLEEIIHLTHQMGINLAGVEMILKLQKKVEKMQKDMNKLFDKAQSDLKLETDERKESMKSQALQLAALKKVHAVEAEQPKKNSSKKTQTKEVSQFNDWDIDYEE